MKIVEAQEAISAELGRPVELVQVKKMKNDVMVLITDDTSRHRTSFGRNLTVHTRRISIYQGEVRIMQGILATAQMKGRESHGS